MSEPVDASRRWFLTQTATVVGAVSASFAVIPFISSMQPSARTQASGAPIEIDISKLEPGQMIRALWRGKPVWVLHRTADALGTLPSLSASLADPASAKSDQPPSAHNEFRSIRPEIFVAVGVCTHLGCSPAFRPEVAPSDLGPEWKGGFFCACHGSRFDLAGRVFAGVPAPKNLEIPPHHYLSETRLIIGENEEKS